MPSGLARLKRRVELGQALQCVGVDELRLQSDERRRLHEPLQRFLVGGLVRFVRIPQDGQSRPARLGALPPGGRAFGHERLDRLEQERAVLRRNVRKAHGLHGIEAPASVCAGEQHSQQRRAHPREQLLGERLVTRDAFRGRRRAGSARSRRDAASPAPAAASRSSSARTYASDLRSSTVLTSGSGRWPRASARSDT